MNPKGFGGGHDSANEISDSALGMRSLLVDWPLTPACADSLTEVTALNVFTSREVPVVISAKNEFDGHLDTVIGERMRVCVYVCGGLYVLSKAAVF